MTERDGELVSILVVDDDETFNERLGRAFERRGFEVWRATDCAMGETLAKEHVPELAVVDLRMPDGNGLDLVVALLEIDPSTNIVVLTGYGSIATALEAIRRGATHYLTKPASVEEILAAFQRSGQSAETADEVSTPSLARVEWEHIQRVLTDCGGNISKAARHLGIHRRSLQRKLAKFPVSR